MNWLIIILILLIFGAWCIIKNTKEPLLNPTKYLPWTGRYVVADDLGIKVNKVFA